MNEGWREEFLGFATGGGDEPPLMASALALSRLLQRGETWEGFQERLAALEIAARRRCGAVSVDDWSEAAAELLLLMHEQGFGGNVDDYDRIENSFVDRVLQDRLGIPITLGVLAIHLGEAVGVPIEGIGFPGHFMVGVGLQTRTPSVFDPFNGGVMLSFEDLAALYRATTGKRMTSHAPLLRRALEPVRARAILSRMLRNLQRQYAARGAHDRVAEVVGLLAVLHPELDKLRTLQGELHRRLENLN
jgi:regulator of sirC expression with transglutaminase-like and TPR domain